MPIPIVRLFMRRGAKFSAILFVFLLLVVYTFPATQQTPISSFFGAGHSTHKRALDYGVGGLASNWTIGARTHPIEELMARGKAQWESLMKRQVSRLVVSGLFYCHTAELTS